MILPDTPRKLVILYYSFPRFLSLKELEGYMTYPCVLFITLVGSLNVLEHQEIHYYFSNTAM